MASKDSGELAWGSGYNLGEYSFRLERSSGTSPNYDKIEAICTKGGKNARKSIQVPSSTQIEGWYVEANETEATVYAIEKIPVGGSEKEYSGFGKGPWPQPINYASGQITAGGGGQWFKGSGLIAVLLREDGVVQTSVAIASPVPTTWGIYYKDHPEQPSRNISVSSSFEYDGKTVYFNNDDYGYYLNRPSAGGNIVVPVSGGGLDRAHAAWIMLYGVPTGGTEYEFIEKIVGRFAIELEDAGGVGPGSDWIDPGDYDPDWEEGDPTHTLYVEVTGALSGRHNDPIVDPSYSYIPADKDTVKDYGCGGDGGHGGGGGAGASTVVVHKFSTNQANSKEVTAIARRHGYGSGGGKGGKGGDGCILVYY